MAKKAVSKDTIQKGYQDFLLEEGKAPETVRIFTKYLKIADEDLYQHFGSLKNIELSIWEDYFQNTLNTLHKDPDFEEMSSREKHLAFLYTILEIMKSDRSFILHRLEGKKIHQLPEELKKTQRFITQSDIDWASPFSFLPDRAHDFTQKAYRNVLWQHVISLLLFWVKDESPAAKDTDLFIEKSTRTAFDIGELPAAESIVDLSKFFLQKMGFSKAAI